MELKQHHKATTSATAYQQRTEKYEGYKQLYTDGLKDRDGVGAALVAEEIDRRAAMTRETSVFSAEMHAIQIAMDTLKNMRQNKFLIISNSTSVLKGLGSRAPEHLVARRLQHALEEVKARGKEGEVLLSSGAFSNNWRG